MYTIYILHIYQPSILFSDIVHAHYFFGTDLYVYITVDFLTLWPTGYIYIYVIPFDNIIS